jgi:hypothetical protein
MATEKLTVRPGSPATMVSCPSANVPFTMLGLGGLGPSSYSCTWAAISARRQVHCARVVMRWPLDERNGSGSPALGSSRSKPGSGGTAQLEPPFSTRRTRSGSASVGDAAPASSRETGGAEAGGNRGGSSDLQENASSAADTVVRAAMSLRTTSLMVACLLQTRRRGKRFQHEASGRASAPSRCGWVGATGTPAPRAGKPLKRPSASSVRRRTPDQRVALRLRRSGPLS